MLIFLQLIAFLIGLAGAGLVAFGTWLVYQPAGYIAAGVLCLLWSLMAARSMASATNKPKGN